MPKGRSTPIDERVGQQLRYFRLAKGMSQEELARRVNITFQQLQKYEKGANRISASRLYEFGKVLKVSVSSFFSNTENSFSSTQELDDGRVMAKKETNDLIKLYYSLKPQLRKDFLKLLRSMSDTNS